MYIKVGHRYIVSNINSVCKIKDHSTGSSKNLDVLVHFIPLFCNEISLECNSTTRTYVVVVPLTLSNLIYLPDGVQSDSRQNLVPGRW